MLPTGTVTFLLSDVEGSTRMWQQYEDVMDAVIARHAQIIEVAAAAHGGTVIKSRGEGDSTFTVFARPTDAVLAAIDAQRALADEPWPSGVELRTRMAIHSGEATLRDDDYFGTAVNRCARLRSIGHGGQILCSQATEELVADVLPSGIGLRDMGMHGLRDLARPERVFQITQADLRDDFPSLSSHGAARTNLPAQRTSLIGRDAELAMVRKLVAEYRLVTLTGVGGCGKTRLAIEAATDQLAAFDSVFFCDLAPVADPAVVINTLGQALGMSAGGPMSPSIRPIKDDLIDFIGDRSLLIVLDNCEHLVEASADLVDTILNECPAVRIIATSREALEVDGERPYTVPSLAVPDENGYESTAVTLFVERARAANSEYELTAEDAPAVAEICRRLDGIPLAIELAAAQVGVLSPTQLSSRLEDRFRLLSGGRRRVQRQQTLAAMLDWSYELLTDDERDVLRQLAVFPQPFTLEQAEAVCLSASGGSIFPAVRGLAAKSLVISVDQADGKRYRLLETVRLYAEAKLAEAGEAEAARSRHRDHVLAWLETFGDKAWHLTSTLIIGAEIDHLRAALAWSEADGRDDLIARIIPPSFLAWISDVAEAERWLRKGLTSTDVTPEQRLYIIATAAWASALRVDLGTLFQLCEEGRTLPPDPAGIHATMVEGLLAVYWATAVYLLGADEAERARVHAARAQDLAKSDLAKVMAAMWIGVTMVGLGDLDAAEASLGRGLNIDLGPGEAAWRACAASLVGVVRQLKGDPNGAFEMFERCAEIFANDPWGEATEWSLMWVAPYGPALAAIGRTEDGIEFMRALIDRMRDTGATRSFTPIIQACLGITAYYCGDLITATHLVVHAYENPLVPIDHALAAQYVDKLRAQLPEDEFERCFVAGRAMTFQECTEMAFASLDAHR